MEVHLIDGTYELFRHFFAVPKVTDTNGREIGAVRSVLNSVLSMIERSATHIGVATDHVVESFRNDLYPGYKTSEGVPPELLSQFPVLEGALEAMGVVVWPMVQYEADDALASAAHLYPGQGSKSVCCRHTSREVTRAISSSENGNINEISACLARFDSRLAMVWIDAKCGDHFPRCSSH